MTVHRISAALQKGLLELGLGSIQKESDRLLQYIDLIVHWNRKHNLTAVRDPEAMVYQHLLDSLSIQPHLPAGSLLDLGSGAGLPGIPLAMAEPDREIVLVDASFKRVTFLREVIRKLGLDKVQAVHARAEQYEASAADLLVTRGFATLLKTAQVSEHLLTPNGLWLSMKGRYPVDELAELESCDESPATLLRVEPLSVPGLDAERHLVFLARRAAG